MLQLPRWIIVILSEELQAIEAGRIRQLTTATMAPHLTPAARRDLLRTLDRLHQGPRDAPAPMPKVRYDPKAAAAYFAARGMQVITG